MYIENSCFASLWLVGSLADNLAESLRYVLFALWGKLPERYGLSNHFSADILVLLFSKSPNNRKQLLKKEKIALVSEKKAGKTIEKVKLIFKTYCSYSLVYYLTRNYLALDNYNNYKRIFNFILIREW